MPLSMVSMIAHMVSDMVPSMNEVLCNMLCDVVSIMGLSMAPSMDAVNSATATRPSIRR